MDWYRASVYLQAIAPRVRWRYVVVAPDSRLDANGSAASNIHGSPTPCVDTADLRCSCLRLARSGHDRKLAEATETNGAQAPGSMTTQLGPRPSGTPRRTTLATGSLVRATIQRAVTGLATVPTDGRASVGSLLGYLLLEQDGVAQQVRAQSEALLLAVHRQPESKITGTGSGILRRAFPVRPGCWTLSGPGHSSRRPGRRGR